MNYNGILIEESLENKDILKEINILNTKIESVTHRHKTPWVNQWTLHNIEIPEDKAREIADKISRCLDSEHNWYADFKNDNFHFIIFRNKVFKIDRFRPKQYNQVVSYGSNLGIPDYQLDFSPLIGEWER